MEYSTAIDWISITAKYPDIGFNSEIESYYDAKHISRLIRRSLINHTMGALCPDDLATSPEHTARRFYMYNWHNAQGFTMSLGTKFDQGVKVQFSGQFLDYKLQKSKEIYEGLINSHWKPTRVDFAYDFFHSGITIGTIWRKYIEPAFLGKKLKVAFYQGGSGDTIYIGSRQSNYMIRIYDKGKEQKRDIDWIRFEIEIKKDGCKNLSGNHQRDISSGASKILAMCRNLPNSISDILKEISGGKTFGTVYNPQIQSDREKYIHTFVVPYLTKAMETDREAVRQALYTLHKAWADTGTDELF